MFSPIGEFGQTGRSGRTEPSVCESPALTGAFAVDDFTAVKWQTMLCLRCTNANTKGPGRGLSSGIVLQGKSRDHRCREFMSSTLMSLCRARGSPADTDWIAFNRLVLQWSRRVATSGAYPSVKY